MNLLKQLFLEKDYSNTNIVAVRKRKQELTRNYKVV